VREPVRVWVIYINVIIGIYTYTGARTEYGRRRGQCICQDTKKKKG